MQIAYSELLYGDKILDIHSIKCSYFTHIFNIYNYNNEYLKRIVRLTTSINAHYNYYTYMGNINDLYNVHECIILILPIKINYMRVCLIIRDIDEYIDIILYSLNTIYYTNAYIDLNIKDILYTNNETDELMQYKMILLEYAEKIKAIRNSKYLLNRL